MESPDELDSMYFGFGDLHGFKDYVVYVFSCAPELFPQDDFLPDDKQMNLERAFVGLRFGMGIAERERGISSITRECRELIDEADTLYNTGQDSAGQRKLEQVSGMLNRLRSR